MTLENLLLQKFVGDHPSDAARTLRGMEPSDIAAVLRASSSTAAGSVLPLLSPLMAARALESIEPQPAAAILADTTAAAAAAVVRTMGSERRDSVVGLLDTERREALTALLRYTPGTAGALMDPEVLSVPETATIGEVLASIRAVPQHSLYYLYVVDEEQKLVGVLSGRDLVDREADTPVGLVANRSVDSLPTRASEDSIVAHPAWKKFHAIPVVEADGRFVGVIRYERLRELEERLVGRSEEDGGAETSAALAELYGLGLKGMVEWAASSLIGAAEPKRRTP